MTSAPPHYSHNCHDYVAMFLLQSCSDYVVAWKLCTTMKTLDVTETLAMALKAELAGFIWTGIGV